MIKNQNSIKSSMRVAHVPPNIIRLAQNRTSIRDFSVRLSFENQAWRDATPFLLFVSVEVGDFYGSDEVVSNCLSE